MSERVYSIDAMRIVAIAFVVMIHTDPFKGLSAVGNMATFGIKTTARFAVPFFFVTSGYFFARKTATRDPTAYVRARIATISSFYLFGLLLAAPVFLVGRLARAADANQSLGSAAIEGVAGFLSPVELVYYGTSVSEILWFLPALAVSFCLVYLFILLDRPALVLPVALAFHIVGLLDGTYAMIDVPFETRDGLFFGFFYTSLGYTIARREWQPPTAHSRWYLAATLGLVGLQLVEFYLVGYPLQDEAFGSSVFAASYGITTALLTTALFLFLLSRPRLGAATPLPSWGKYAVGIYVTHPAVFAVLRAMRDVLEQAGYTIDGTIIWHLLLTPVLLSLSYLVYIAADRLRIIEIGGTHLPGRPWIQKN